MASHKDGERVQQLFRDAARLPEAERDQWLRDQCENDEQLLREVHELLRYHDLPSDPLESGPQFRPIELLATVNHHMQLPTVPGYRIEREIGSGRPSDCL